jgi:hypothetical protein
MGNVQNCDTFVALSPQTKYTDRAVAVAGEASADFCG